MSKKSNTAKTQQTEVELFADSPVKYNGKRYYNEPFTADAETAKALIEDGVCVQLAAEPEQPPPNEREQIITAAIAQLKPEQFDTDGKPALKALAKLTNSVVTEDERNAVWKMINANNE